MVYTITNPSSTSRNSFSSALCALFETSLSCPTCTVRDKVIGYYVITSKAPIRQKSPCPRIKRRRYADTPPIRVSLEYPIFPIKKKKKTLIRGGDGGDTAGDTGEPSRCALDGGAGEEENWGEREGNRVEIGLGKSAHSTSSSLLQSRPETELRGELVSAAIAALPRHQRSSARAALHFLLVTAPPCRR